MAFFDFTGANGDPLPDFFTVENGTAEIQDNRLSFTGAGSWQVSYPSNIEDTQTVEILSTTGDTAGVWYLRYLDGANCLCILFEYEKDEIRLFQLDQAAYYAPVTVDFPLSSNTRNVFEAETTSGRIILRHAGVDIINYPTTKFNTATKSAFGGSKAGSWKIDSILTTPATGDAPVISDTGNQTEQVYKGEPVASYTITALDSEDGDITNKLTSTGSFDTSKNGSQSVTYSVADNDGNRATYTKTINVVTRPVISLPADIRNPMELKVGQTFVLPVARFHDPDNFAYGEVTGQGWSGTGSVGTQTVTYNYANPDGSEALEVALEINVVAVPTVTSTYPFSMLQEYAGDTVTIDGYELTYFENSDGSSFGYGFANEQRVESTGTKAATNDSFAPQEVAMIKLPFDSAAMADKIRVYVEVEMSGPVDGTEIQLGFSKIRNAEKYRMRRYFGSETKAILEFDMIPFDSDHFRIGLVGNGNDPDKMIVDDNPYFNTALSTEVFIPIHVKFGNTDGGVTLTKVDAYAVVGPAQFNKNGSFLNGRDRVDIIPFADNDPLNLPLPSNLVVREPVMTYNRDDVNFDHFETAAGSDYVTVGQTDGVRVGDLVVVFRQTHSSVASDPTYESEGARLGSVQVVKTLEIFGKDVRVKAVLDGTTLQLSRPALISYKSSDDATDYLKRFYGLVTLTAENASILIGSENDSWATSLITGKSYPGNKATAYNGMKQVYYCKSTDPIERFNYSRLVTPNNWIFPIPDDADTATAYGEAIINGWFEMPTPVEYDGTFNSANNADRNVIFITPDKRYAISVYLANPKNGNGHYTCGRVSCWDMSQYSIPDILFKENLKNSGESASTRASSISMAAGFIRKEEADLIQYSGYDTDEKIDADMAIARNAIKHAITYVPASPVLQSLNYINDLGLQVSYFSHESYVVEPVISNAGTGYAVGDVCYLGCDDLVDTVEATRFVVQAVGDNGEILKVFTTHTGQHKINCGNPNHAPYETSGNGVGATFDTSSYISQSTTPLKAAAYPATIVDGNNAQTGLYAGSNPMGGVCTIKPSLDIHNAFKTKLKARIATSGEPQYSDSYEFYAVLCAIEKYGLIPCDTSTGTSVMFAIDARMTAQQKDSFFNNAGYVYRNAASLRAYLVPVDNYTPTHALTNEDLLPALKLEGDDNLDVTSEWSDIGAHAYTPLYGDKTITSNPPFAPQTTGAQTLSYQYTDRSGVTSNVVQRSVTNVDAQTVNVPPTANAGADQSVTAGANVQLDGTGSTAVSPATVVTYTWTQIEGETVTLDLSNPSRPAFVAPTSSSSQTIKYGLTVTDSNGLESTISYVDIAVSAEVVDPVDPTDPDDSVTSSSPSIFLTTYVIGMTNNLVSAVKPPVPTIQESFLGASLVLDVDSHSGENQQLTSIDMSTLVNYFLLIRKPNGIVVQKIGRIDDNNYLICDLLPVDLEDCGTYKVQAYLQGESWSGTTTVATFEVLDNLG